MEGLPISEGSKLDCNATVPSSNLINDNNTLLLSNVIFLQANYSAQLDSKVKKYPAILDTGSAACVIPRHFCNDLKVKCFKLKNKFNLIDFEGKSHNFSGDIAPIWIHPIVEDSKPVLINFIVIESGPNILINQIVASKVFNVNHTSEIKINHANVQRLMIESIYGRITPKAPESTSHKIPPKLENLINVNKNVTGKCSFPNSEYTLPRTKDKEHKSICMLTKPKYYGIRKDFKKNLKDHIKK